MPCVSRSFSTSAHDSCTNVTVSLFPSPFASAPSVTPPDRPPSLAPADAAVPASSSFHSRPLSSPSSFDPAASSCACLLASLADPAGDNTPALLPAALALSSAGSITLTTSCHVCVHAVFTSGVHASPSPCSSVHISASPTTGK